MFMLSALMSESTTCSFVSKLRSNLVPFMLSDFQGTTSTRPLDNSSPLVTLHMGVRGGLPLVLWLEHFSRLG